MVGWLVGWLVLVGCLPKPSGGLAGGCFKCFENVLRERALHQRNDIPIPLGRRFRPVDLLGRRISIPEMTTECRSPRMSLQLGDQYMPLHGGIHQVTYQFVWIN